MSPTLPRRARHASRCGTHRARHHHAGAPVRPLADLLGIDDVIATRWTQADGAFTGRVDGDVVWGPGKRDAVLRWCTEHDVDPAGCWAYSDSYYDSPLLDAVGHPVAVNPDARLAATAALNDWPIRSFQKPEGVSAIGGFEIQDLFRPFLRPEFIPNADVRIAGIDNIPATGGAIIVGNHRSYFDPAVMITRSPVGPKRSLPRRKRCSIPVIGPILQAGGIRVDRGTGDEGAFDAAAAAIRGGDVVVMFPQADSTRPGVLRPRAERTLVRPDSPP